MRNLFDMRPSAIHRAVIWIGTAIIFSLLNVGPIYAERPVSTIVIKFF